MTKNVAVILAGGSGIRLGKKTPKQFLEVDGTPLLGYSLEVFERHPDIHDIIVVVHPDFLKFVNDLVVQNEYSKVSRILEGGKTRQDSSRIGVMSIGEGSDHVLIHDAARPFVNKEIIDRVLSGLDGCDGVTTVEPVNDTIVSMDENRMITRFLDRNLLGGVQTPQGFQRKTIQDAHRRAQDSGISNATDDCSLLMACGSYLIRAVSGSPFNIKITNPKDMLMAPQILEQMRLENE